MSYGWRETPPDACNFLSYSYCGYCWLGSRWRSSELSSVSNSASLALARLANSPAGYLSRYASYISGLVLSLMVFPEGELDRLWIDCCDGYCRCYGNMSVFEAFDTSECERCERAVWIPF